MLSITVCIQTIITPLSFAAGSFVRKSVKTTDAITSPAAVSPMSAGSRGGCPFITSRGRLPLSPLSLSGRRRSQMRWRLIVTGAAGGL